MFLSRNHFNLQKKRVISSTNFFILPLIYFFDTIFLEINHYLSYSKTTNNLTKELKFNRYDTEC